MQNQRKKIKLLTYNVFLRPPPIKTNADDFKNQRLNDILQNIQKFDIVCFQQMFQTATFRKQKVIQRAFVKGFYYWKDCQSPAFWNGPPVDSGLLVISKFPILQSHFQSYNVGILSDSASDKGFIYCKVEVEGKILHLFTTHLQASYLHPGMLYERQLSIKTRLYQFKILAKRIKQILQKSCKKPNQQLVLLMGDLNMNALMVPINLHCSVLENEKVGKLFVQYDSFMRILQNTQIKPTNCGHQSYKKHPITFGDGDQILTDRLQSLSKQALDFIFNLQVPIQLNTETISPGQQSAKYLETDSSKQKITTSNLKSCGLKPLIQTTKVEEFKVKDKSYNQLSDHYGMSIQISIQ